MKKHITILLMILALAAFAPSTASAQEEGSRISLPDSLFDFGFFATDAKVQHTFPIINTGNGTLEIITVKPTCGCTTAPLKNKKIAPGDTTYIDLYFDSKRRAGLNKKTVTIISNDPVTPLREIAFIAVTGRPHPFLDIEPGVINMGRMSASKIDRQFKAAITNKTDQELKLDLISYTSEYVDVELQTDTLAPGASTQVLMTLKKIPEDPRNYSFSATLSADNGETSINLTVPAIGRIDRSAPK